MSTIVSIKTLLDRFVIVFLPIAGTKGEHMCIYEVENKCRNYACIKLVKCIILYDCVDILHKKKRHRIIDSSTYLSLLTFVRHQRRKRDQSFSVINICSSTLLRSFISKHLRCTNWMNEVIVNLHRYLICMW